MKSRIGEMWEADYNGYPIIGQVVKSICVGERYNYYPHGRTEVWNHFVKILRSSNPEDIGKTRKWKEHKYSLFEQKFKYIEILPRQWVIELLDH